MESILREYFPQDAEHYCKSVPRWLPGWRNTRRHHKTFASRKEAQHYQLKLKEEYSFLNPIVMRRENTKNEIAK